MIGSTYEIDGVGLDDARHRWRLEKDTRLPAGASWRVATIDLPQRDGVIPVRQGADVGQVGLSVAVLRGGADNAELDRRVSVIHAVMTGARQLTWLPTSGGARVVNVVEAVMADPIERGPAGVQVQGVLTVDPFWREVDSVTTTSPVVPPTSGAPLRLTELAGSAPVADAIIRIRGPLSSMWIEADDGTGVRLGESVDAGAYLYVDVGSWRAYTSSSPDFPADGVFYPLDYPPGGRLRMGQARSGADPMDMCPVLRMGGTGIVGGQTTIAVRGSRWWM